MTQSKTRRWLWPGALFALIGGNVAAHVTMVFVISARPALTADLRKVHQTAWWGDVHQARDARDLGWTVRVRGSAPDGVGQVDVELFDGLGAPVDDARVEMRCFPRSAPQRITELVLSKVAAGQYRAPLTGRGEWDGLLLLEHEGVPMTTRVVFTPVPPPPPTGSAAAASAR